MSESPSIDVHKAKALELAVQAGGEPAKVVERAHAYHEFLNGKGPGKPAGATAAQTPAATTKSAAATTGKPAAATTGKPAAAPKATPAAGTKPAAAPKAGAAAPKAAAAAAAAPGAAPKGDTKDPKGNNTYDDVTAALQKVMRSVAGDNDKREKGRALAYEILSAKGGGVKGVRDLKPALYDAVVAGCEAAVAGAAGAVSAAAPKATPKATVAAGVVEDDLGGPVDTSGASAETAGEDDPPEGGSGEGEDV
jgi:hypothetical protein